MFDTRMFLVRRRVFPELTVGLLETAFFLTGRAEREDEVEKAAREIVVHWEPSIWLKARRMHRRHMEDDMLPDCMVLNSPPVVMSRIEEFMCQPCARH